jgi:hypothetical protein
MGSESTVATFSPASSSAAGHSARTQRHARVHEPSPRVRPAHYRAPLIPSLAPAATAAAMTAPTSSSEGIINAARSRLDASPPTWRSAEAAATRAYLCHTASPPSSPPTGARRAHNGGGGGNSRPPVARAGSNHMIRRCRGRDLLAVWDVRTHRGRHLAHAAHTQRSSDHPTH